MTLQGRTRGGFAPFALPALVLIALLGGSASAQDVVISELMYAPAGGVPNELHEFVELYNPSPDESVDLSGWRLEGVALTIPPGTVILPESYALFVRNDVAFRQEYGGGRFIAAQ